MHQLVKIIGILFLAVVFSSVSVFAVPGGAGTTLGNSEQGISSTATDVNISANNVTFVDVSTAYLTEKWTGFYGNITGGFILGDSSGNNFYEWTIADMTGAVVYASNSTVNWGTGGFFPLAASYASPWLIGSATDNFTNTYNDTEHFTSPDFFTGTNQVNDTPFVATFNSSGDRTLKTYALRHNTTNQSVYAAKVIDDTSGFTNRTLDYQMLVPAYSVVSYYFYLELP